LLKKKVFASWDRFLVPYPAGRGLFLWGTPIRVAPEATEAEQEVKRRELEDALNRITAQADEEVIREG
jgi:lysophospholipid acyltransferase (LPLAT)-like uncharacterized protein